MCGCVRGVYACKYTDEGELEETNLLVLHLLRDMRLGAGDGGSGIGRLFIFTL